jgi:hypothetical protein
MGKVVVGPAVFMDDSGGLTDSRRFLTENSKNEENCKLHVVVIVVGQPFGLGRQLVLIFFQLTAKQMYCDWGGAMLLGVILLPLPVETEYISIKPV